MTSHLEASVDRIRANRESIEAELVDAARVAGRDQPARLLVAAKYVQASQLSGLAEAGISLLGENRLQDLKEKQAQHAEAFEWHFIGALQSKKIKDLGRRVSLIHSVASKSVLEQLGKHDFGDLAVLIQVNIAGEAEKQGVALSELDWYIEHCPVPVHGLMTMPPATSDPEQSRKHFARLRELASDRDLPELSIGTSQDYKVAAQEGATIVRLGSVLFA